MPTYKPFDLDAAMCGAKVVTTEGYPTRILCFDRKGPRPIIALVQRPDGTETLWEFTNEGDSKTSPRCLVMAPLEYHHLVVVLKNFDGSMSSAVDHIGVDKGRLRHMLESWAKRQEERGGKLLAHFTFITNEDGDPYND